MTKRFMVILSMLLMAVLTACASSNGEEEATTATTATIEESTESNRKDETDASWTEYASRSEAEAAVGFSSSFSESIVNGTYHEEEFRVKDGILEITFVKDDSSEAEDSYVIRQAKKTSEDISDDSNSYSHDFTLEDCGIDQIRLRGTKDNLAICSFDYGDYSYVIYPGSMNYEETFIVIGELTGIKSTEY